MRRITCPGCGAELHVREEPGERWTRCAKCAAFFAANEASAQPERPVGTRPLSVRKRSGTRTLVIVLLCVGAVVLVAFAVCGGFLVFGIRSAVPELQAAQATSEAFLTQLAANEVDAAYKSTATGFQARTSASQFEEFVSKYPALTNHTSRRYGGVHIRQQPGGATAYVRVTVLSANNSLSCTLVLVKEGGQWKVYAVTVP